MSYKMQLPPSIQYGIAQWQGDRTTQQDAADLAVHPREQSVLGVVTDGMGGMANGERFSQLALQTILSAFVHSAEFDIPALLLQLLLAANEQTQKLQSEEEQGGTTVVMAAIHGRCLWIASVGDSSIYLYRGGTILQLNRQHTLGTLMDEKVCSGLLSWEDAENNAYRHAINSFIGDERIKHVDLAESPIHCLPNDVVLLMSDGVTGTLSQKEMADCICKSDTPQQMTAQLIQRIQTKKQKHQDNATVLAIKIG